MSRKTIAASSGAALAIALAGALGAGSVSTEAFAATQVELRHCYDVNVCKGHNDCKTANNACAGQGSCKGKGFVALPETACKNVGGSFKDDVVAKAEVELVHCLGVNTCKGHNDCKTANNACAGKSSCKGKGFVAVPAKACSAIGGKTG